LTWPDALFSAARVCQRVGLTLPGRFNATYALCADGGCMTSVGRQHQPVSGSKISVARIGVEDDPAADGVQHLLVAVLMPAVGIAGGVTPPMGSQAVFAHPRDDLILAGDAP
jgi:hypothetical protein